MKRWLLILAGVGLMTVWSARTVQADEHRAFTAGGSHVVLVRDRDDGRHHRDWGFWFQPRYRSYYPGYSYYYSPYYSPSPYYYSPGPYYYAPQPYYYPYHHRRPFFGFSFGW